MVSPLIVGAAKVTKGVAKKGAWAGRKTGQGSGDRMRTKSRSGALRRARARHTQQQRKTGRRLSRLDTVKKVLPDSEELTTKLLQARAAAVSYGMVGTLWPSYIPQLLFWLLGIAGMGVELVPLVNVVSPGMELLLLAQLIIGGIGLLSMAYAVFIYSRAMVDFYSGVKTLIGLGCLTLYFIQLFNFIPWIVVWFAAVTILQKPKEQ